jgi:cytochrome oxidase Cu insertion factor (SCO1/SenC/PrrC family)
MTVTLSSATLALPATYVAHSSEFVVLDPDGNLVRFWELRA